MWLRVLMYSLVFLFSCQGLLFLVGFIITVKNISDYRAFRKRASESLLYKHLSLELSSCWWMFKRPSPLLVTLFHRDQFLEGGNSSVRQQFGQLFHRFALAILIMQIMGINFILMAFISMMMMHGQSTRLLLLGLIGTLFLAFTMVCHTIRKRIVLFSKQLGF